MLSVLLVNGEIMSNYIVVYWAINTDEWVRAQEPVSIYNNAIRKDVAKDTTLIRCPSFKDYMKNIYGIQSIYSYTFSVNGNVVSSQNYNQEFFNEHVVIRSAKDKCFSFNPKIMFFTEEKSLRISTGIHPFFEENEVSKRCMTIPGTLDIGKWFRQIDFAFFIKNEYNEFIINENDIYQYIQFHTDKKIIFKQFYMNDYLNNQHRAVDGAKYNRPEKFRKLEEYYNMFKNKNNIIKEIKKNLT